MPTTTDLLGLAIDKNPVDFADTFNQIMMQKAHDALENKRVELAQSIYGEQDSDLDDDAVDFDDDDMDIDDDAFHVLCELRQEIKESLKDHICPHSLDLRTDHGDHGRKGSNKGVGE